MVRLVTTQYSHKKMVGGVKDKRVFLTNTTENYSKPTHVNNVHGDPEKLRKTKIKIKNN